MRIQIYVNHIWFLRQDFGGKIDDYGHFQQLY